MLDKQADLKAKLKAAEKLKADEKLKDVAYENLVMTLGIKDMKIDPDKWDNSNLD